jgi:Cu(I)/Ag(I) efflux system periplasmic protein CusF
MKGRSATLALAILGLAATSTAALAVDGEVTKIDEAQGKITVKHGPIDNLGMPAMTMVFKASDPTMLKQVKVGDVIVFEVDKVNGAITITKLIKVARKK